MMYQLRLAILAVVTFPCLNVTRAAEQHPNVVIILADDFGVGDIQTHYPDNKIATPHLDRLVRQGMR